MVTKKGKIKCKCGSYDFYQSKDGHWLKCSKCERVLSIHDGQIYIDKIDEKKINREIKKIIKQREKEQQQQGIGAAEQENTKKE